MRTRIIFSHRATPRQTRPSPARPDHAIEHLIHHSSHVSHICIRIHHTTPIHACMRACAATYNIWLSRAMHSNTYSQSRSPTVTYAQSRAHQQTSCARVGSSALVSIVVYLCLPLLLNYSLCLLY